MEALRFNPPAHEVSTLNLGGGTLAPVISDDAAWLITFLDGETLNVYVDKEDFPAGHYQAIITVTGEEGSLTQNSPQTILVDLWLLEGAPPGGVHIYLPLVGK